MPSDASLKKRNHLHQMVDMKMYDATRLDGKTAVAMPGTDVVQLDVSVAKRPPVDTSTWVLKPRYSDKEAQDLLDATMSLPQ